MVWYDDNICRVDGAMNWPDVDGLVDWWEERGLVRLVYLDAGKRWKDFCVVDLTRFSGHITVTQRGVQNVEERQ